MADENFARLLPFLALPDGAHLSEEDYSYFVSCKPATLELTTALYLQSYGPDF